MPDNSDEKVFQLKLTQFKVAAEQIPGAVIIHRLSDFRVEYMSPWGMERLGVNEEEVLHLSDRDYHARYFNPDDAADYGPKIRELLMQGNINDVVSFFQQVRTGPQGEWQWHMTTSRIFMKGSDGQPQYLISVSCPIDPEHHITGKVNRLLQENNYLKANSALFGSLTRREKELLSLLALGKSSREIAEDLFISESTVETHRKSIRRKIGAKNHYDIILFAQSFDLI